MYELFGFPSLVRFQESGPEWSLQVTEVTYHPLSSRLEEI